MTRGTGQENRQPMEVVLPSSGCGEVDALPRKEGRVEMQQSMSGGRVATVPVVLKVYATAFGRYAVVAQDRTPLCKDCGFINLRNCTVQPLAASASTTSKRPVAAQSPCGFQIVSRRCEGEPLRFTVRDKQLLAEWLSVLDPTTDAPAVSGRKTSSPIPIPSSTSRSQGERGLRRPLGRLQSTSPKSALPCLSEGDEMEEEEGEV